MLNDLRRTKLLQSCLHIQGYKVCKGTCVSNCNVQKVLKKESTKFSTKEVHVTGITQTKWGYKTKDTQHFSPSTYGSQHYKSSNFAEIGIERR